MSQDFLLYFNKNILLIKKSAREVVIRSPLVYLTIPHLTPGLLEALQILATDGATEEHLSDLVLQTDGESELPKFYYYLKKFNDWCMICYTVLADGCPMATLVPISRYYRFHPEKVEPEQKYLLSRFAYCRKYKEQMVLESPLSHAQIILYDRRSAAILIELVKPHSYREIATKISGVSEYTMQMLFSLLLSAVALSKVTEDGKFQEEENNTLEQWSFHNLLFHAKSRIGRNINLYKDKIFFFKKNQPFPVVKQKMSEQIIDLFKPDIEKLKEKDYSFTFVLETRKSIRTYQNEPITDKKLGEFLYRAARIRSIIKEDSREVSSRPYPNAGAYYELEIYVTVNSCENIPFGLYHYCPKYHQLCKLADNNNVVALLQGAAEASRKTLESIQVLITIAARFPRFAWQYEAIAYATTLKNVGVLYQTMYLVATAMDLAPCALSFGDSDLFAKVAGTDYYSETSVGEFLLGSKPTD